MSYDQEHSFNNSSEIQRNPNIFDQIKRGYQSAVDYIKERSSETSIRVIGTTAGIALSVAALSGCATGEAPEKPTTTSSAEATPTETPVAPELKEYTTDELIAMEDEPLPEALAQYESMSVQDFEALPIEERLTYCSYLNRDQNYLEGQWYEAYDQDARYIVPENLDENSTAQEIVSQGGYDMSNAFVTHFGGKIYDRDTAQKQIACGFYTAAESNSAYAYWTDQRNQPYDIVPPKMVAEQDGLKQNTAIAEKPSYTLTTKDGKEYLARDITSQDAAGNTFEETDILVSYTDYKGNPRSTYVVYSE